MRSIRALGSRVLRATIAAWFLALAPPPAAAAEDEDADASDAETEDIEALPIEVHGFVSQGFIKSTGHNYLADSKRGSFEFSEVGLNVTKVITDRLRAGVQLFARDIGPIGDYRAHFDWYYLDYQFADWLGVRAGRTKLPFGLYNEVSDIDSARVPILLPQSIYPSRNRDFLLAQTGLELYGLILLGPVGALEYRIYGGSIHADSAASTTRQITRLIGGRLLWEAPLPGLRLGGSVMKFDFDLNLTVPASVAPGGLATYDLDADLGVASLEYAGERLLLAAEYSRTRANTKTSIPALIPNSIVEQEQFYGMAAYRLTTWLTGGIYYAAMFKDLDPLDGSPRVIRRKVKGTYQHDVAATVRFDINAHWLLKLEGHYMRGIAGLQPADKIGQPPSTQKSWAVFLAKTTVHF